MKTQKKSAKSIKENLGLKDHFVLVKVTPSNPLVEHTLSMPTPSL
jgi:hypothetical protein